MPLGNKQLKLAAIGGDMYYNGNSNFVVRNKETKKMVERKVDRVGMVAAGSGITPMFQVSPTPCIN